MDFIRRLIRESQRQPAKDDIAVRMLKGFNMGTGKVTNVRL